MRALFFGTYDAGRHPRVAVLVEGLRRHGADVVELNVPSRLGTAQRVDVLRRPWRLPVLLADVVRGWVLLLLGVRDLGGSRRPDVVVVGYLGHFDVLLARRLFTGVPVVLDHLVSAAGTAADRGERGRLKQRALRRLDAAALAAADVVVVDTEESLAALPVEARDRSVVVAVGATESWFARRPQVRTRTPLTAVFVGLFTPLHGAPTLARALACLPEGLVLTTLVGTGQDHDEVRRLLSGRSDVVWHDWVDGERLPGLVAAHDVSLGIFGTGAKATTVVPTKVYQGAAAGCAVVTSGTPPQRRVLADAAAYVEPGDAAGLAALLRDLADDPDAVARLRAAAAARAQRCFSAETVVRPLMARLGELVADGPTAAVRPTSPRRSPLVPPPTDPPLTMNATLRWDVVSRALPDDALRVLEIGTGLGAVASRLARRYPDFVGLEPDRTSFETARARLRDVGRGQMVQGGVEDLEGAERFDVVCAFEVIEHIEDDAAALAQWASLLSPGGTLLLSTPGYQRLFGPGDEMAGHFRRYEPESLRHMLAEAGLEAVTVRHYGFPLGHVLERGRRAVGRRIMARNAEDDPEAVATRTAGSGRMLQPDRPWKALAFRTVTAPFVVVQRRFPDRGTTLVAWGRRPSS